MIRVPMTGFNPLPHPGPGLAHAGRLYGIGQRPRTVAKKYQITLKEHEESPCARSKQPRRRKPGKFKD